MVRTKQQLDQTRGYSLFRCARDIYRHNGLQGFWRGMTASLLGLSETVIFFLIYENLKSRFIMQGLFSNDLKSYASRRDFKLPWRIRRQFYIFLKRVRLYIAGLKWFSSEIWNDSANESKVKTMKRFKIFRIIKLWEITNIIYDFNVLEGNSNFTLLPSWSH